MTRLWILVVSRALVRAVPAGGVHTNVATEWRLARAADHAVDDALAVDCAVLPVVWPGHNVLTFFFAASTARVSVS